MNIFWTEILPRILLITIFIGGPIIILIYLQRSKIKSGHFSSLVNLVSQEGISKEPSLLLEEYLAKQGLSFRYHFQKNPVSIYQFFAHLFLFQTLIPLALPYIQFSLLGGIL